MRRLASGKGNSFRGVIRKTSEKEVNITTSDSIKVAAEIIRQFLDNANHHFRPDTIQIIQTKAGKVVTSNVLDGKKQQKKSAYADLLESVSNGETVYFWFTASGKNKRPTLSSQPT